jgi:hypothetical protein
MVSTSLSIQSFYKLPFIFRKTAQRLAAQPLGRFRFVITILAGILKSHFNVHSLSLGQVGCSRGLGGIFCKNSLPII